MGGAGRGCGAHHCVGRVGGWTGRLGGRVLLQPAVRVRIKLQQSDRSLTPPLPRPTDSSIAARQPPQPPHTTMVSGNRAARPSCCRPPAAPPAHPAAPPPHAQPRQHSAHRPAALTLLFAGAGLPSRRRSRQALHRVRQGWNFGSGPVRTTLVPRDQGWSRVEFWRPVPGWGLVPTRCFGPGKGGFGVLGVQFSKDFFAKSYRPEKKIPCGARV